MSDVADSAPGSLVAVPGLRVLEVGAGLGVASAGLALVALGADVVQVRGTDPDADDDDRAYYDRAYYDRGRSVVGETADLAERADLIVTDVAELAEIDLRGGDEAQALVAVRSLGSTGPNRGFRMTDLTEWAAGGLAQVTRRPRPPDSDEYVPVLPPGSQPQALAGLAATSAALAAHRWARRRGEPVVADVSVQEVVASVLHGIFPNFVWNKVVTGHPDTSATALGMLLPAADGDVYIRTLAQHQWENLIDWVDGHEWAALGATADLRLANHVALVSLLGEWTSTRRRQDLLVEGQRRRVPVAVPRSLDDVLAWQHLRARGAWRDLGGGVVPRVPLLEPPAWPVTSERTTAEVAARWAGGPTDGAEQDGSRPDGSLPERSRTGRS